jgi:glycosyltransferase involved in cell wall biosynthesis
MSSFQTPMISIGLPVYNGENYLAAAIESISAQSFKDFELIISDNASTDRTSEICRYYMKHDKRVRYFRNKRNLGAAPNYNRTYDLARGKYFKWTAHDDMLCPDFLKKCVKALEADSKAVLCQSLIEYIDENEKSLGIYDSQLAGAESSESASRFKTLVLRSHACTDFFGLIRRETLDGSLLHGDFNGHDRAFLAEMALRGRFIQIPEPLLKVREHPARYTQAVTNQKDRLAWHDASRSGKINFPTWRLYSEYFRMVPRNVKSKSERVRCYGHLMRWVTCNWNLARLMVDIIELFMPGVLIRAEKFKQKVFSPAPRYKRSKIKTSNVRNDRFHNKE